MNLISIVHELRRASGSNRKMTILLKHRDNAAWKSMLVAMYDDSINYGISAPSDTTHVDEFDWDMMYFDLNALSSREYTGNAARQFSLQCSRRYGAAWRMVLDRSLRAGVSITTINKAYPKLIPTFDVMLAKDERVTEFPCIVSTKYDGVRLLAFVSTKANDNEFSDSDEYTTVVTLKLRSGKVIHISSLEREMGRQPPGVYDGELVSGDGLQEGRTKITGQVNKCLKGTATDIDDYTFCIFDLLTHREWNEHDSVDYYQRLRDLNGSLKQSDNVRIADMYMMQTLEDVDAFYEDRLDNGYEGVIVRYASDKYVWGRSTKLIKKKALWDWHLKCVGATPGEGKYEGMIGALMLAGQVPDPKYYKPNSVPANPEHTIYVEVKTGSGLADHDREQNADYYIGKCIDMQYNDVVKSKTKKNKSLFLPRYKRISGDHNV